MVEGKHNQLRKAQAYYFYVFKQKHMAENVEHCVWNMSDEQLQYKNKIRKFLLLPDDNYLATTNMEHLRSYTLGPILIFFLFIVIEETLFHPLSGNLVH